MRRDEGKPPLNCQQILTLLLWIKLINLKPLNFGVDTKNDELEDDEVVESNPILKSNWIHV